MPAAAPLTGQIVTSATPTPLSAVPITPTIWVVKAPTANASTVYLGSAVVTTTTGWPLEPGDTIEVDRRTQPGAIFDVTPSDVYVIGSGGIAAWLAFR